MGGGRGKQKKVERVKGGKVESGENPGNLRNPKNLRNRETLISTA